MVEVTEDRARNELHAVRAAVECPDGASLVGHVSRMMGGEGTIVKLLRELTECPDGQWLGEHIGSLTSALIQARCVLGLAREASKCPEGAGLLEHVEQFAWKPWSSPPTDIDRNVVVVWLGKPQPVTTAWYDGGDACWCRGDTDEELLAGTTCYWMYVPKMEGE